MRKTPASEHQLKLAIRDVVARNPLVSVSALQRQLKDRGFKTAQGNPLDWYYVSKVIRKLNREKALAVDLQKINERLAETKERYRERLWKVIDWKFEYIEQGSGMPGNDEVICAANTIIKFDSPS